MTIISGVSSIAGLFGVVVAVLALRSRNKNIRESNKLQGEMEFRRTVESRFSTMEDRFAEIRVEMRDDRKELQAAMDKGFSELREDIRMNRAAIDGLVQLRS